MGDSSIPITGGSGYSVDTRTESANSNHRQVVVIGDPSSNGGVAPVDASTGLSVNVTNTTIGVTDGGGTITVDDGGSSLTVDGSVSATQSGTWNVTNVSGTVSLPTGASTSAKQDTQITSLSNIETSVGLIDDAVYTDGTGTPSKALAVAGTDGTNPQIISTNSSGHVNIADGGNSITVDGTVAATQSGTWNVTNISGTVSLPTGAATSAKQDTQITSLQLIDDSIYTSGSGTPTAGVLVLGNDGTNPRAIAVNTDGEVGIHDGGNSISVDDGSGSLTVDGTVTVLASTGFPSVVSDGSAAGTNAIHVAGTDGTNAQIISTNVSGHVNIADGGNSITVDDGGSSVTVDGTVTSNAGTGFPPVITDGSTAGTTGIHILGTDGTNGQIISTNTTGHVNIADGGNNISIDDGGNSITVDGTVAATQSGNWSVRLTDGTDTADVLDLTNSNPLTVAIVDTNGDQIASFGGGTQYAANSSQATPTGTVALGQDASNNVRTLRTTSNGELNINIVSFDGASPKLIDYDTGAGTDSLNVYGIALPASGGAVAGGTSTNPIQVGDAGGSLTVDGTVAISGTVAVTDNSGTLSVDDGGGSLTIDGTVAATQSGTWTVTGSGGTFPVTDSAGSLTVDAPVGTPVFVRLSDGSSAITTLPVSLSSVPSHAVTNAGTFVVQENGAALTALQLIDNPVVVDDAAFTPATTSVMMAGFEYDDTSPDSVNEGDAGAARMSANRNIYTTIRDAAGNERGVNINASNQMSVSVDNTVTVASHAVTNAGTFAVQAAQSGTWTLGANSGVDIGDVTINNTTSTPVYTQHNLTGIGHGVTTVTTAGTDVALAASTACKRVIIQSQTDNTTGIAVGASGVDATIATGNGIFLYPGDSIELETDNLADIFIDSLTNGEGVRYIYFT